MKPVNIHVFAVVAKVPGVMSSDLGVYHFSYDNVVASISSH